MKLLQNIIPIIFFSLNLAICQDHSINFDGDNDYILIPDHASLDLTETYTLEAWIFPESFTWLAGIISKYHTSAANGYMLRLTHQAPHTGLGVDEVVTSTGVLNSNQWYHIAAVNNRGDRTLYINGSEHTLSGTPLNVVANNDPLMIGSDYASRYFDGRIDEIRIWNISRSQDDIVATMDTVLSGSETGLVAYYTFNEGSGDTLFDQTGHGHTGALMGNPSWADGYTLSGLLGDINFDESLNIYDAVMLVAIMLAHEDGSELQLHACDTNQDGVIDIEDIVLLIQWILDIDGNLRAALSHGEYSLDNRSVVIESDGEIAGFQMELSEPVVVSEIHLPSGWGWNQNGAKCVAYSMDGSSLPDGFTLTLGKSGIVTHLKLAGWGSKAIHAQETLLPESFGLQVGPNPFNPRCTISFELSKATHIELDVYNLKGQYLASIMEGMLQPGNHQFYWVPSNVSSGAYFIRISDGKNSQLAKILYLK